MQDVTIRIRASLARACVGIVTLGLPYLSNGSASVDICQEPVTESHLSIAYYDNAEMSFERNPGETDREDFSTNLLFTSNDNWILGAGHRSTVLNVERLEPQTNGYLHTFFFPVHGLVQTDNSNFRFSIAPALSGSSNVTKDPREYRTAALQLLAAFVWNRPISDRLSLRYGICGDHRFGDFKVYPVFSVNWHPHPDWKFDLGFPSIQLSHQVTKSLASMLRIAPNGNEWYVKDRSLENHSQLYYESFLLEWTFGWRVQQDFMLSASVGREFHSRYEMTLLNGNRVRLSGDAASRIGIGVAWFF